MFFDDAKKASTIIRGKRDHRGARLSEQTAMKPEVVKTTDGEIDPKHVAMQDFLAAHKEGSAAKMSASLTNFMDIHHAMNQDDASEYL